MNINFCFVRHGYACHNAVRNLYKNKLISYEESKKITAPGNKDPELTEIGVQASINNGMIITKLIKEVSSNAKNKSMDIQTINVVGCSPLIRSMETAYYMTRKWKTPPNKIYVLPILREIDEGSSNKYSKESRERMNGLMAYGMKSIEEQKEYLKSKGILEFFNFDFVEGNIERTEPGDINKFINWISRTQFCKNDCNMFIVTHAGVLNEYAKEGFFNNSGFVVNYTKENNGRMIRNQLFSLNKILPRSFFYDYDKTEYNGIEYYCPSNRCSAFCTNVKNSKDVILKKIKELVIE